VFFRLNNIHYFNVTGAHMPDTQWVTDVHVFMGTAFVVQPTPAAVRRLQAALQRTNTLGRPEAIVRLTALVDEAARELGPNHSITLDGRRLLAHHVGGTDGSLEAAAKAIAQLESLLPDATKALGLDHPVTLLARRHLAYYNGVLGNWVEAIDQLAELVPDMARVLGPNDEVTLIARRYLAYYTGEIGRTSDAVRQASVLLADAVRTLGPDHKEVRNIIEMLGRNTPP
jgi:hypothetical protein